MLHGQVERGPREGRQGVERLCKKQGEKSQEEKHQEYVQRGKNKAKGMGN